MLKSRTIRLIRRYPNRRLYDVTESRYVNLEDLHQLVKQGVEFQVLVDKTNQDQTKSVLMQIFLDLEMSGKPIFSDQSLKNLIVMNHSLKNELTQSYLSRLFSFFTIKQ
jgi:polyhydroxyalkanoate synthesis repressor PhaR